MMEDTPGLHNGGQVGSTGGMSIGSNKQQDEQQSRPQYSMPGILHFLQTEWARFEMERSQWEVERAELQARIAFLQGERKGQENLKQDLVRRIKMLEFALKQERAKFHKLKYGTDLNQGDMKPPTFEKNEDDEPVDGDALNTANSNVTWRQGRQLLRQYLQEIGYTDTIIDVRSSRVRQLLGLQPNNAENEDTRQMVNGEGGGKRPSEGQGRRTNKKTSSMVERAFNDSEASVIATFDFLSNEVDDEDENLSDGENEDGAADDDQMERRVKPKIVGNESMAGMDELADPDTEEALAEFDFLVSDAGAGEARSQGDGTEWDSEVTVIHCDSAKRPSTDHGYCLPMAIYFDGNGKKVERESDADPRDADMTDSQLAPCQEGAEPSRATESHPQLNLVDSTNDEENSATQMDPALPENDSLTMQKENDNYINSQLNKHTMKKMNSAQKSFEQFLHSKQEATNMLQMSPGKLDQNLATWLLSLKRNDGSEYEPDTLSAMLRGVSKYFEINNSPQKIIEDKATFNVTHSVLTSKRKELKKMGKGNRPNKAIVLSDADEELLWDSSCLGLQDPETLLHTMWFHTTKLLGFWGSNESRQLKWGDFTPNYDDEGNIEYISWNERGTKTKTGMPTASSSAFVPKLFPNKANPSRCPIQAFLKYQSKRPQCMLHPDSPFYLVISHRRNYPESPWYLKSPMGYDRIGKIMSKMAVRAGLHGKYTNHSVRPTMCTNLLQAGVPPTLIAQLSGHKHVRSLSKYVTASLAQQRGMSDILQGNAPSADSCVSSASRPLAPPTPAPALSETHSQHTQSPVP